MKNNCLQGQTNVTILISVCFYCDGVHSHLFEGNLMHVKNDTLAVFFGRSVKGLVNRYTPINVYEMYLRCISGGGLSDCHSFCFRS